MTNEHGLSGDGEDAGRKFDLGERTACFGEAVIGLVRRIKVDPVTSPLVKQLVRSATSIGANYCEADEAGSKKEFCYRISVCNRETRETKYWLRMLAAAAPSLKDEARQLWREANELNLIFSSIYHRSKRNEPRTP
jgi:four helix bundle protein